MVKALSTFFRVLTCMVLILATCVTGFCAWCLASDRLRDGRT